MNLKKGFFRLWLVLSLIWVCVFGVRFTQQSLEFERTLRNRITGYELKPEEQYSLDDAGRFIVDAVGPEDPKEINNDRERINKLGLLAVIPPIASLVLGTLFYWALAGFVSLSSKGDKKKD